MTADVESATPPRRSDLVVCNPPYFAPAEGRKPRDESRLQARFGNVEIFAHAAARFCGQQGRTCFVYPASNSLRLLGALRRAGLEPKRLAWVHPESALPARLVLVEAKRGKPGGLVVEAARIEVVAARPRGYAGP